MDDNRARRQWRDFARAGARVPGNILGRLGFARPAELFLFLIAVSLLGAAWRFGARGQRTAEGFHAIRPAGTQDYEFYGSGAKKCVNSYEGRTRHGVSRCWYENGQLQSEIHYVDGKKHGPARFWMRSGQPDLEDHYVRGIREGVSTHYYEGSPQVRLRGEYRGGRLHGVLEEWLQDGTRIVRAEFANSLMHGRSLEWHANGKQSRIAHSVRGNLEGDVTEWHENGQLKLRARYARGKLDGKYEEWYVDGRPKKSAEYRDGAPVGTIAEWPAPSREPKRSLSGAP